MLHVFNGQANLMVFSQYSVVWKDEIGTNCLCLDDIKVHSKLFELEKANPGTCHPDCGQQMCGTLSEHKVQSVTVFVNHHYSPANRDCDDVFMRTQWPPSNGPFIFKSFNDEQILVSIF